MKNSKNKDYAINEVTPFSTIKEMLVIAERESGDKAAFMYRENGEVLQKTYKEFRADTISLGSALAELGLENAHIACIGDNSYRWALSYLTVIGSTAVFVPIDKELPPKDIQNLLRESDCDAIIYADRYNELFASCRAEIPAVKTYISMSAKESTADTLSFDALLAHGYELNKSGYTKYTEMTSDPNALKLLVYTSGTTGLAKGVMLTEHNLVSGVYYGLQISTVYTRCLSVLPLHHTYESVSGLLVALHKHVTICINDSLRNVLKNLQYFKPDYIYVVPAFAEIFYNRIWDTAASEGKDKMLKKLIKISNGLLKIGIDLRKKFFKSVTDAFGGNLIKIVSGGAPMRSEIGDFFESIGICLVNGYGITECSPLVSANRDYFNDPATVGVPLPCLKIHIDKPDEEGNGEICVKGDVVMLGYYKNPEATANVLIDGWFHTGDFGHVNDKNQIVITGRKKNIIVLRNGKNIYPEELENYIQAIPSVKEVIVGAVKSDDGADKQLSAEVYLDPEKVAGISPEELAKKLRAEIDAVCIELPKYKQIASIIIRDKEFEKTTTNKIKR